MANASWSREGTHLASLTAPTTRCDAIHANGTIPHVTWEPWNGDKNSTQNGLQSIINGTYDVYLGRWAWQIRNWKEPLFIRWAHEMNGDWYPWDGTHNGGLATTGYGDPTKADGPER